MNTQKDKISHLNQEDTLIIDEKYYVNDYYQLDLNQLNQANIQAAKSGKSKPETYQELMENPQPIIWKGFENDPDLAEAPIQIEDAFGSELLKQCLISEVDYQPNIYFCVINGKEYFIPQEMYQLNAARLKPNKYRAMNSSDFIIHHSAKAYYRTPIRIFAFDNSEGLDQKYLTHIDDLTERKRLYKIGTIIHEIGHHMADIIVKQKKDNWKKWQEIVSQRPESMTSYSKKYQGDDIQGDDIYFCEEFAEAIRLYTTSQKYLRENYRSVFDYIQSSFPQIKNIS
ncbi:MAG: hypothetical protein WC570_03755 [Patescibacteria group bacterium]